MSGPRPSRKRPSAVPPPGRACPAPYGTATIKRLFALCIVGWGLDPTGAASRKYDFGMAPGAVKIAPYKKQWQTGVFLFSKQKKRGPLCLGAARDVLM